MGDRSGPSQPGDEDKALQIRSHITNLGPCSSNMMEMMIAIDDSKRNPQNDLFDRFDDFEHKIMALLDEYFQKQMEKLNKISVDISAIKDQFDNLQQITDDLVAENNKFKKYFESIKSFKNITDQKLKILQIDVEELRSTLIASIKDSTKIETSFKFEDVVLEINERFERKKNIIIVGVAEPPFPSYDERQAFDTNEVRKIIQLISSEFYKPIHVVRLGVLGRCNPRVIKVRFETPEEAIAVLRNKNKITNISSIRIYPDETSHQRQFLQKLRSEMKSRKKDGEADLTIKYRNGIPKIVTDRSKSFKNARSQN